MTVSQSVYRYFSFVNGRIGCISGVKSSAKVVREKKETHLSFDHDQEAG